MKADAKPTFADVAQLITNPAPDWLVSGLASLSGFIRDTGPTYERGEAADEIDRLRTAIKTLRRLLPLFLNIPYRDPPITDDVVVVLDALPRIEALLARANLRREKRTPDFQRECCCSVILEAARNPTRRAASIQRNLFGLQRTGKPAIIKRLSRTEIGTGTSNARWPQTTLGYVRFFKGF
jgi:hypothetical protein